MPKVSVIIPTYQSVQFVRETIDSVLAQTYRDYEVIVVDGGSTDGTRRVLNSYGNRIRVISQNGKGISNARNVGVLESKGEYITFVDSDDLWLPNKLEVQVKFMGGKPNIVGLIYSDALFFAEKNIDEPKNERAFQITKPYRGRAIKHLFMANFIPTSTVMVRKLCFEKFGLFDESLSICEDRDMWIRVAESFEIDYQDVVLAKIRLHTGSLTHDREQHLLNQIKLKNKITRKMSHLLKGFDLRTFNKRFYKPYLRLGILYILRDEPKKAKQKFKQYIELYPYDIGAYLLLVLTLFPLSLTGRLELYRYMPRSFTRRVYENLAE